MARQIEMLSAKSPRQRWRAMRGLTALGSPAVQRLLAVIRRDGHPKASPHAGKMAALALARMESRAIPAIPHLVRIVKTGTQAQGLLAIQVLGRVGPFDQKSAADVRTAVIEELNVDLDQRHFIAPAIANLAIDPRNISQKTLLADLRSRDATRRIRAARLLGRHATDDEERAQAAAQLTRAVRERQPRNTAYRYRFKTLDYHRVTETHREEVVAQELALALERLRQPLPVVAWAALSTHEDPAVRQRAVLALGASGASEAARPLVAALDDADRMIAWDAITALGMLGKAAASVAEDPLRTLSNSEDKGTAARARAALRRIRGS